MAWAVEDRAKAARSWLNWNPIWKRQPLMLCEWCQARSEASMSLLFDAEEEISITRYWGAERTGAPPTDARQAVGRGTGSSPAEVGMKGFSREWSKGVWPHAEGTFLSSTSTEVATQPWSPKNWWNLQRFVRKDKSHGMIWLVNWNRKTRWCEIL